MRSLQLRAPLLREGHSFVVAIWIAIWIALFPCALLAQTVGWRQMVTSSYPVLDAPVMAFDRARNVAVLVGRTHATNSLETWEWDGTAWTPRCVGACGMPTRGGFALSFDPNCGQVLLFGGYDSPTQVWFDEVWAWTGSAWLPVATTGQPLPGLAGAAWCFDEARNEQLLYGGGTRGSAGSAQNGTWSLQACGSWTNRGSGPAARALHGLTYDAMRQRCVLYGGEVVGGCSGGCTGGCELFEWDGSAWICMPANPAPAWRYLHGQAYDRARQQTIVFGGFDGSSSFGDTWMWNGVVWTLFPGTPSPPARHAAAMCYDEARLTIVLYGGSIPTGGWYADTWTHGYLTPIASYTPFGAGCAGPTGLVPSLAGVPGEAPRIGTTSRLRASNLPLAVTIPIFLLGTSNAQAMGPTGPYLLPFDLSPLGWLGCQQLVSVDDMILTITNSGQVDHPITVPPVPSLAGFTLHAQLLVLYHPQGVALSNGVTAVVGY